MTDGLWHVALSDRSHRGVACPHARLSALDGMAKPIENSSPRHMVLIQLKAGLHHDKKHGECERGLRVPGRRNSPLRALLVWAVLELLCTQPGISGTACVGGLGHQRRGSMGRPLRHVDRLLRTVLASVGCVVVGRATWAAVTAPTDAPCCPVCPGDHVAGETAGLLPAIAWLADRFAGHQYPAPAKALMHRRDAGVESLRGP